MKGAKNDFSMIFFYHNDVVMKLTFVHNTDKAVSWMKSKNKQWTHANIYDRREQTFIKRIYSDEIRDVREYLIKINAGQSKQ